MKKTAFSLLLAASAFAAEWTGYISDAACGVNNARDTQEARECAQRCVKAGQDPVFVVGDKVFKLKDKAKVMAHVGHKVTINGSAAGDLVSVQSIKMAK
jgi:hypothetical protein